MSQQHIENVRHRRAFRVWYDAGRVITDEVMTVAGRKRDTIYKWRDRERWDLAADELDRQAAQRMGEVYEEAASETHKASRELIAKMFENAQLMNQMLHDAMNGKGALDEFTVQAIARYSLAAIDSAAKLYQWAQKLDVEHSGSIGTLTDEQRLQIVQRLAAVVNGEA